jgi:hypothetical protein
VERSRDGSITFKAPRAIAPSPSRRLESCSNSRSNSPLSSRMRQPSEQDESGKFNINLTEKDKDSANVAFSSAYDPESSMGLIIQERVM